MQPLLLNSHWLRSLSALSGTGESLKYDEVYVALKNTVSQVSFDPIEVIHMASTLLLRSHDWVLCQYLLLGCAAAGYTDDFLIAMEAYEVVLKQGGYPHSEKGRESALYWLNQSTIMALLDKMRAALDVGWQDRCAQHWESLQSTWKERYPDEALSWHALGAWLSQIRTSVEPVQPVPVSVVVDNAPTREINESWQASEQIQQLWEFHWKKGDPLKAMCLARQEAWLCTTIPNEVDGKSWVPPLCSADKQQMARLCEAGHWELLWKKAEQCFLEAGGPYDVQLQHDTLLALEKLNKIDMAHWVKAWWIARLESAPALLEGHFNDGTPFCDASLRGWAHALLNPAPVESIQMDAFEQAELGVLRNDETHCAWVRTYQPQGERERLSHHYLWVLMQTSAHQYEKAWQTHRALMKRCEEKELFEWDPQLMRKVWTLGLDISKKVRVECDAVLDHMMRHDLNFAQGVQNDR